jgi:hypothetical protein
VERPSDQQLAHLEAAVHAARCGLSPEDAVELAMVERPASVSDEAVTLICLTILCVTFMVGGIVLVCAGHDAGLVLCGAALLMTWLLIGG